MKVCIIGSSGQLGYHLYEKFKKNSNYYFFSSKILKPQFIKGSLTHVNQLILKLKKIKKFGLLLKYWLMNLANV